METEICKMCGDNGLPTIANRCYECQSITDVLTRTAKSLEENHYTSRKITISITIEKKQNAEQAGNAL